MRTQIPNERMAFKGKLRPGPLVLGPGPRTSCIHDAASIRCCAIPCIPSSLLVLGRGSWFGGGLLTVGAPVPAKAQFAVILADLLAIGIVSRKLCEKVLGLATYIFSFRPEFQCLMHRSHQYVHSLYKARQVRANGFTTTAKTLLVGLFTRDLHDTYGM